MSEAKFTPGDWMRGNCESYGINGEPFRNVWSQPGKDGVLICRCFGELCDENAQLIAASKKLLAALEKAVYELNAIRARDGVPYTNQAIKSDVCPDYFSSVVDECFAAIALAQGA